MIKKTWCFILGHNIKHNLSAIDCIIWNKGKTEQIKKLFCNRCRKYIKSK